MFFKPDSFKDLLLHLLLIVVLFSGVLLYFFNSYLPDVTRHGEELTVPDLEGKFISGANDMLTTLDLRSVVNDSAYVEGEKPGKIISQHPLPGSKVKANRQIYLTITSENPTNVELPADLTNKTLKNVKLILSQVGLYVGNTTIVEDQFNLVLKATFKGKEVTEGSVIPKYSRVDLVIGSGRRVSSDEEIETDTISE